MEEQVNTTNKNNNKKIKFDGEPLNSNGFWQFIRRTFNVSPDQLLFYKLDWNSIIFVRMRNMALTDQVYHFSLNYTMTKRINQIDTIYYNRFKFV